MQSMQEAIKKLWKEYGVVAFVEKKTCDVCGDEYSMYERTDREGNKHLMGMCMTCENKKLRAKFPKTKEELDNNKFNIWISNHENIEKSIHESSFESYKPQTDKQREALRLCKGYVSKFNNFSKKHSLVFKGDVGLGKSHLAASILKELREQGYKVMFLTTTDLMNMIKSTFNYNSAQTQDDIIKRLESLDLLVLDDVGAEYVKRDAQGFETWASEVLFQVINSRQALPTVYTTNYSAGDFSDKYGKQGKRILSRMLNSAEIIAFDGVDQRVNNF